MHVFSVKIVISLKHNIRHRSLKSFEFADVRFTSLEQPVFQNLYLYIRGTNIVT